MNMLKKIVTVLRSGVREFSEAIIDKNAIQILAQEIHAQEAAVAQAKDTLTEVMAGETQAARKITLLTDNIKRHERNAAQAIAMGDDALALEIAGKIAEYEHESRELHGVLENYKTSLTALKDHIRQTEKAIQENKRELSVIQTTDNLQRAHSALNKTLNNNLSKASAARESLTRIRERQRRTDDKMSAAAQLAQESSDTPLKERLAQAGITHINSQASDVLSRLTQKHPLSENLLKTLIVIAMADNRIHPDERQLLLTLSGEMGVNQAHLARLIREVMHGDRNKIYAIENQQHFEWACDMANANGAADEKQLKILTKLAELLNIPEKQMSDYLNK